MYTYYVEQKLAKTGANVWGQHWAGKDGTQSADCWSESRSVTAGWRAPKKWVGLFAFVGRGRKESEMEQCLGSKVNRGNIKGVPTFEASIQREEGGCSRQTVGQRAAVWQPAGARQKSGWGRLLLLDGAGKIQVWKTNWVHKQACHI